MRAHAHGTRAHALLLALSRALSFFRCRRLTVMVRASDALHPPATTPRGVGEIFGCEFLASLDCGPVQGLQSVCAEPTLAGKRARANATCSLPRVPSPQGSLEALIRVRVTALRQNHRGGTRESLSWPPEAAPPRSREPRGRVSPHGLCSETGMCLFGITRPWPPADVTAQGPWPTLASAHFIYVVQPLLV